MILGRRAFAIIASSLLTSGIAFAAPSEQVERIYDFSERISLMIDDQSFQFTRCSSQSCEDLTPKLPRVKDPELLQQIESRDWSPFGAQVIADVYFNFEVTPADEHAEMITHGISILPEKFNVACSGPVTTMIKKLNAQKEKVTSVYQFAYIGPSNRFCRTGQTGQVDDLDSIERKIKQFRKSYVQTITAKHAHE